MNDNLPDVFKVALAGVTPRESWAEFKARKNDQRALELQRQQPTELDRMTWMKERRDEPQF